MEGIVNLLKPPGITSSDAVCDIRRIFGLKRVGHTGTLDPGAAGVLPICIGRATRLFDYLVDKEKEYIAEIAFGAATDTQDAYGAIVEQAPTAITAAELSAVLPRFFGEQEQIAPMYSAVRVNGRRLYEVARAGGETIEKRRQICVSALELLEQTGRQAYLLRMVCSKGTYVRTLCYDIGRALGVPAHLSFLLRTQSGAFTLRDSYTLEELRALAERGQLPAAVISAEQSLSRLPAARLTLDDREIRLLRNGAPVRAQAQYAAQTPLRVYVNDGFWGIGKLGAEGLRIELFLGEENG
ncbi:MAG: tRNA pseudouridine(55) synthase TruB [Christensenellaceae bacterium]|nr:tRNA pseudouridine(55) synthase TruB [Christensenellaceae bacterium]